MSPVGQKMVDVIRKIQESGIFVLSSIICGLESDTKETLATMKEFAKESGTLLAQFTLYTPYPGTVDFYNMVDDMKLRAGARENLPLRKIELLYDRFWIDPKKPTVLIKHPNMDDKTLLGEIKKNWNSFYSFRQIIKRAMAQNWPWKGKVWYFLGSLGFKSLYAGYGIAADSVKSKKMALATRFLLKITIVFHNYFFRKRHPKS